MTRILLGTIACLAVVFAKSAGAGALPEYAAVQARKHIGERATVVGKVACRSRGRTYELLQLEGCNANSAFDIVVRTEEVNGVEFEGVTVAVSGKIERFQDAVQIVVQSPSQIVARTPKQTDYTGRAYDKETKGDIDGAIADLNEAIEHQPARRDEACEHLARVKEKRGDWAGALAAYERLIAFDPNKAGSYYVRATAKKQHGDFEGAMADFTRAAELRSSSSDFVQIGNFRKAQGDATGAAREYDKAIAVCDKQIAGATSGGASGQQRSEAYFGRGYAKEMKGEIEGAEADYSSVIAINPAHAAGAYSRRGDMRKARGDLQGAVADYEQTFRLTHYPDDEKKLKQTKAELKGGHVLENAASELTDAQIKEKLLGYWKSPRHGYLIKSDGVIYMLPRKYASSTNRWNVKGGLFYWDDMPNEIITLDDKKCIYRSRGRSGAVFTLVRSTKEEADPD